MEIEVEVWKDIPEYEGLYQISNLGRVKSLKREVFRKNHFMQLQETFINSHENNTGYLAVGLYKNSKGKRFLIHRLIAINFIPNPNNLLIINHIDGNPLNNKISNLEWATQRENCCHAKLNINQVSKYTGVSYSHDRQKYASYIRVNGKKKFLGRFNTELEAYNARVKYEKENGIVNKYL